MEEPPVADLRRIRADLEHFCAAIGRRLAGSPEEKRAAEYTADRFRGLGLENVALLPFRCKRWLPGAGKLDVVDPPGRPVEVEVVTHTPATPPEGVAGDLRFFEPADWEEDFRPTESLEGCIGLFYGGYGESARVFEQLHASPLEALLFVDTRLHTGWPVGNGLGEKFMRLVRKPMAYVSLLDAWALKRGGVRRVRLTASGRIEEAASHNVVGELPGSDPSGRIIVVSAHLDSVVAGVGADDDAAGMAAMLECARRLRSADRRHTLRFIGFGAEEQLSVGSTRYVREQVRDLDRAGFVCNFDSLAAWLGLSKVMCTGTPDLETYVKGIIAERLRFGEVYADACPYQDQFPFAAHGIPGVWFTRQTHLGGYWYHHSAHNSLENCSVEQIARTAAAACEVLRPLAARAEWPFPRRVSPELREKIARYLAELFD